MLQHVFEMTKQYVSTAISQVLTTGFGEVRGFVPSGNLVQVVLRPSPLGDKLFWLPLVVPLYGIRGVPKYGDQAVILFAATLPVAVVGFTYNAVDVVEEAVVSGQFRMTQKQGANEADLLIDGTTGQITLNKGTAGVARVGDAVSVTGTVSAFGTVTLTGTITAGSTTVKA